MDDQKAFSSSMNDQKALSSSNDGQQALSSSMDDQQATSFSMDNQQISSSSLHGQQEHIPQPYDESWFDLANSCGKEFELPNISDPVSLDLSINSNNLLVSPFQRLDIPCGLDEAFLLDITGPSSAGNQLVSLPLIEMVPSVTNSSSAIDQQDICIPPKIPCSSNASQWGSDIFIIKDHTHISCFGCSSSLEANGSSSMSYQLIGSSNFADAPCFLSSGSGIISNGEVGDPVTSYALGSSANGYKHDGSEHLQNPNHRIGIRSNLCILMKNQEASRTHAALSNFCGSESNEQNFGTGSLQVGQPSSCNDEVSYFSHMSRINGELKYICKDRQKEFPNYNAFGGHMSFHAKARKMIKKLSSPTNPSQKYSIVSGCLIEAADKNIELNNSFNQEKGKLVIPSEEESAVEKLPPSGDLVKEDFSSLCRAQKT